MTAPIDPRLPDWTLKSWPERLTQRLKELLTRLAIEINQKITVRKAGTRVGTRDKINFVEGSGVTLTITEDITNDEIDIEIAAEGGGGTGCCYTNSTYEEPTTVAVQANEDDYTERPDWVYVPYGNLTDGCSALVTASLSIEMWPSTPACPPTTVWVELWVRYPDDDEEKISARHYLRAPTYTPEACGEDPEVTYPMIMNVALTGRHPGGDYESGRYEYFWRLNYFAAGLDEELYPNVWWDMHVGVFPCIGYQPS